LAASVVLAACSERPRVVSAGTKGEPITLVAFDANGTRKGTIMDNKVIKKPTKSGSSKLTSRAVCSGPQEGHRARIHQASIIRNHDKGTYLCVCCANCALQLRYEIRIGHGLAKLLGRRSPRKNVEN